MKTFFQLTEQQQQAAILREFKRFKSLFVEGFIESEKPIGDDQLMQYAETAAEAAHYKEGADNVMEGIADHE